MQFKIKDLKRKYFFYLFSIFTLWFIIHITATIVDGLSETNCTSDLGVIMGNKVNEDGSLSPRLENRLSCGLKLYQSGRIKHIMVSGGFGKEGFYEGNKMRDYLISHNIPDSVIIVDNKGDNTLKTVKNSVAVARQKGYKAITVISQYYHLTRCKMLYRKNGLKNVCAAAPPYYEVRDIYSLFREFWAYYF